MNKSTPEIHWLKNLDHNELNIEASGGKAAGLNQLMRWGLNVPNGFVIINAQKGNYPAQLGAFYKELGSNKVAVRSSALGEDGNESSFAGQYESILNVQGYDNICAAIDKCVESLQSQRAASYQKANHIQSSHVQSAQMNIVVQNMVNAASAGVVFTVDPVSGRHDRLVIDAVNGLGEALVSGEETPDHYEFDQNGKLVFSELISDSAILSSAQCNQLYKEAIEAAQHADKPLDLEWAIDQKGQLFWLQARPITTIGSDLNELDTPIKPDDILTRCNVGEMMPGAVCPLTFSTTGRCIEHGMQHMHVAYANRPAINNEWTQIAMNHGKLFINLSGSAAAGSTVLGINAKAIGYSVCGETVTDLKDPPKKNMWTRFKGAIKMLQYLLAADNVIAEFKNKAQLFSLPVIGNSQEIASALDSSLSFYSEAMAVHLQSSATSGVTSNILQSMISGGQESTPAEEAEAANLMAGATGVESAVLVEQLDQVIDQIAENKNEATNFINATSEDALSWLSSSADKITTDYKNFIQRHGHRGYRELCMRELSWADAPEELVKTIQASVKARLSGVKGSEKPVSVNPDSLSRGLRWILPKAHNAIRRREDTKSLLVNIGNQFKRSYRALGERLTLDGKLKDMDQLFFFTHEELMDFVYSDTESDTLYWQRKTNERRKALEYQNKIEFNEICKGSPVPIDLRLIAASQEGDIVGRPVSSGIVEGLARVAFNVSEAAALQPGEILVAPITDVGWTPYFSVISGLITDVGSSVSHGAVIAREYGLPAIVNTRVATQCIKTGDKIHLDANTGIVTHLK